MLVVLVFLVKTHTRGSTRGAQLRARAEVEPEVGGGDIAVLP